MRTSEIEDYYYSLMDKEQKENDKKKRFKSRKEKKTYQEYKIWKLRHSR